MNVEIRYANLHFRDPFKVVISSPGDKRLTELLTFANMFEKIAMFKQENRRKHISSIAKELLGK